MGALRTGLCYGTTFIVIKDLSLKHLKIIYLVFGYIYYRYISNLGIYIIHIYPIDKTLDMFVNLFKLSIYTYLNQIYI